MKNFFLSLLFVGATLPPLYATEYFGGGGAGAVRTGFPERDYETPWINDLLAQINASPALNATNRANAVAVVEQLTLQVSPPGVFGTFTLDLSGTHGEIVVEPDPDYIVDGFHRIGTHYLANLTLEVPSTPPNTAPTIAWSVAPMNANSRQTYTIAAHGHDADGNLAQVNLWKNGVPFAFAGAGDGTDGDAQNPTADLGPATITFTAQAVDALGATSSVISHTVTIAAPNITLTTSAGPGGSVSPGGSFPSGTTAAVTATPAANYLFTGWSGDLTGTANPGSVLMTADRSVQANFAPVNVTLTTTASAGGAVSPGGTYPFGTGLAVTATADVAHDFAGWSGDASGFANPFPLTLDRNKSVTALFALKAFTLTTLATAGGTVTPGGSYPFGTTVTVTATADAMHRFIDWTGDGSGSVLSLGVMLDRAKTVQANFLMKTAQSIDFTPPDDRASNVPPFGLVATSSSGLPITFTVLSGPATLIGSTIQLSGAGTVVVEASQPGDGTFLPAPPITASFNVTSPVTLKYQTNARTQLGSEKAKLSAPLLISVP